MSANGSASGGQPKPSDSRSRSPSPTPEDIVRRCNKKIASHQEMKKIALKHGLYSEAERHKKVIDECQHAITETKSVPIRREIYTKAISRILLEIDEIQAKHAAAVAAHDVLVTEKKQKLEDLQELQDTLDAQEVPSAPDACARILKDFKGISHDHAATAAVQRALLVAWGFDPSQMPDMVGPMRGPMRGSFEIPTPRDVQSGFVEGGGFGPHGNDFPSTPQVAGNIDKDAMARLLAEKDAAIGKHKAEADEMRKQRLLAAERHAQAAQAKTVADEQALVAHNDALARAQLAQASLEETQKRLSAVESAAKEQAQVHARAQRIIGFANICSGRRFAPGADACCASSGPGSGSDEARVRSAAGDLGG